jgi:hypothetical protein
MHPKGSTQTDKRGPVDLFPAQMWEIIESARTAARVRARLLMFSPGPPGSEATSKLKRLRRFAPRAAEH